ncbi:molybdenum cofactor cytidylyltransferase/nicotine blue oxidoreductase [Granulicella pectinivorans]|uniref:Molybdenum cofactor cytidylyltransferase/nicotine blue oxidoreductase n=1 Tax=Granulicella pectinivorans TaxID=474950 RepID=A0A1I6M5Y6_9BACT|nr:nucleotidyltransferase family protein [Granulicella pectinivorans]SFS10942.1 molybdenum cofactor cytidylyltransferase/nicotine blue oxidoreductase [Granulicella pectinivorans]
MKAAVILAGGSSSRLGEPKQLVRIGGETLLDRTVRVAREAGCDPVVVVLGASAARVEEACALEGAVVLENELWGEGMGSSLRMGIAAVRDLDGAVVMTCDMPAVTAGHLLGLMAAGGRMASRYGGRNGVPGYFPAEDFEELLRVTGDVGARELLRGAAALELAAGEMDLDTEEDLERVRMVFGE